MFRSPWEIEVNARYARQRVAAGVAACRGQVPASTGRPGGSTPAFAPVLRLVGRGLIRAGQRLAGPDATRPAPTVRPAA